MVYICDSEKILARSESDTNYDTLNSEVGNIHWITNSDQGTNCQKLT